MNGGLASLHFRMKSKTKQIFFNDNYRVLFRIERMVRLNLSNWPKSEGHSQFLPSLFLIKTSGTDPRKGIMDVFAISSRLRLFA